MNMTFVRCFDSMLTLTLFVTSAWADEPKPGANDNKLVGTWKVISAKYGGQEVKREEGISVIKHVTPTQFMWAFFGKDGKVVECLGGTYTMKGNEYTETPEYGSGDAFDQLKGKEQTFTWKVEGNKWHHTGKLSSGLTIEEVWERVEKK